jgi:hypothetical protein
MSVTPVFQCHIKWAADSFHIKESGCIYTKEAKTLIKIKFKTIKPLNDSLGSPPCVWGDERTPLSGMVYSCEYHLHSVMMFVSRVADPELSPDPVRKKATRCADCGGVGRYVYDGAARSPGSLRPLIPDVMCGCCYGAGAVEVSALEELAEL